MKEWVLQEYDAPPAAVVADARDAPMGEGDGAVLDVRSLSYAYGGGSLQVKDVTFSFGVGARILVVGANGAGKSTVLSILGGKRMVPRGFASILGKDCFNDPGLGSEVMYCGDWWRTKFFSNMSIRELLGPICETARCQHLREVLQVNLDWMIN